MSRAAWEGESDSPGSETSHPRGPQERALAPKTRPRYPGERRREGPRGPRGYAVGRPRGAPGPARPRRCPLPPPGHPSSGRLRPGGLPEPLTLGGTTPRPLRVGPLGAFSPETIPFQQFTIRESVPRVPSGRTKPRFPSPRALIIEGKEEGRERERKRFQGKEGTLAFILQKF